LGIFFVGEFLLGHGLSFTRELDFTLSMAPGPCTEAARVPACANFAKFGFVYAALWLVLMVVAVAGLCVATASLRELPQDTARKARRVALALGVVIAAAVIIPDHVYEAAGRGLFLKTVGHYGQLDWLKHSLNLSNVLVGFSAAFIATACCATVLDLPGLIAPGAAPNAYDEHAVKLENRLANLRIVVLFGTLLLVTGIALMAAYLSWPAAFMKGEAPNLDPPYQAVANGIVTLHGASYSMVLFILFGGPAAILYVHLLRLADGASPDSAVGAQAFINRHKMTPTVPSFLANALAVAAPLVASQFASLAKLLPAG
jgi:hypothetical protein